MPDLSPSGIPVYGVNENPNLAIITQAQANALDPITIPAFANAAARDAAITDPQPPQLCYLADGDVFLKRIPGSWVQAFRPLKNIQAGVFGTNGANPYDQVGTKLVTTDSNGYATVNFAQPFQNSIIGIQVSLMDASIATDVKTSGLPTALTGFLVRATNGDGAAGNVTVRVSFYALGS